MLTFLGTTSQKYDQNYKKKHTTKNKKQQANRN